MLSALNEAGGDVMVGILIYNDETDRLDVLLEDGTTYGGLHCGEVIEARIGDFWKSVRVENNGDWYLAEGFTAGAIPANLAVRLP